MKPAAFAATYSDFRLVKGRKVAIVCLEIPIEQAEAFVAAFGLPNPASETWVGIARLKGAPAAPEPEKPTESRKRWGDLSPAQQAGIACQNKMFRQFLAETEKVDPSLVGEDIAAALVRERCKVESRADIKPGTKAAQIWADLYSRFELWQRYPEHAA